MINLVDAARAYLGVPFRHQGRNKLGLDCVGLVVVALADIGIVVEDEIGYSLNPHKGRLESGINRNSFLKEVPVDQIAAGDVLLIAYKHVPQHVAIKTTTGIIHSTSQLGKVVEHGFSPLFGKIVSAYRIR